MEERELTATSMDLNNECAVQERGCERGGAMEDVRERGRMRVRSEVEVTVTKAKLEKDQRAKLFLFVFCFGCAESSQG